MYSRRIWNNESRGGKLVMWEIAKRKHICLLCNIMVLKGQKALVLRARGWNFSSTWYICAEHFKFKDCKKCDNRITCVTGRPEMNNDNCDIYKGILETLK
jgi:hypothetical protein